MKNNKIIRFFALALIAVLAIGLVACNKDNSGSSDGEDPVTANDVFDFVMEVEAGREIKILQLTDIQIIDSSQQRYDGRLHSWSIETWAPDKLESVAFKYMREAVSAVNPDLIVLSGDNVYGEFDDSGAMLTKLIAEMESYGIPWTLTFGNHDNETYMGVEWTCDQYANAEHCMFTRGDLDRAEGNGNFNIAIMQGGELSLVVWLMDSNGHTYADKQENMYRDYGLLDGQLNWFEEENIKIKEFCGGKSPASIGFFHHPMRAFGDGLTAYGYESAKNAFMASNGDWGVFKPVTIPANENGDSGAMNLDAGGFIDGTYEFHNLLVKYGCKGWFFGHDHRNNASVMHEGVRYTYGLKASKYDDYQPGQIGGTKITAGGGNIRVTHVYTELD